MSNPESDGTGSQNLKVPKSATRALLIMGTAIILVLYVHTSLSPALPMMADDFDVDYSLVTWVLTAYLVSGAAVTIIIGRLADIYGAKKMLLVVFICYTVGVIFAPFTENFYTLIGLRVLQGVAVALVPVSVRIARDLYPPAKFPFAQGMILSMYQGGSAIGLVLGAAVVYFVGWQGVFLTAIPFSFLFLFLLWKFIPKVGEEKIVKDTSPKHFSKIVDIPGLITLILTVSTFMLSITFLGGGTDQSIGLFWVFLAIGIISIVAFFVIEKRSKIPLVDLKLAFHRIIRVGNVVYLLIGIVQYIIFSTIPTLGQTPEPYGLGLSVLDVGILQLPQALVFVALGPVAGILAVKYGNLKFIIPGSIIFTVGILVLMVYHSTVPQVASTLVLFAVGGAFVTLSANVIIFFTPRESTAVVSATYSTMRIIGGAIGPVIAGVFISLYTSEVTTTTTDVGTTTTTSVPNDMAFTTIFLVGAICSLAIIAFMMIMRRRAVSMGMPVNK